MNDEQLADLMADAENALVNGDDAIAAQALEAIAQVFGSLAAGLPDREYHSVRQSFIDVRKNIIFSAEKRTNKAFIQERLSIIERERRNDRSITNIYTGKESTVQ